MLDDEAELSCGRWIALLSVSRLHTAIDERERIARAAMETGGSPAGSGVWSLGSSRVMAGDVAVAAGEWHDMPDRFARHIVVNDPDSVLRLCQAHRDILTFWEATKTAVEVSDGTVLAGAARVRLGAYLKVVEALARGYGIEDGEGDRG